MRFLLTAPLICPDCAEFWVEGPPACEVPMAGLPSFEDLRTRVLHEIEFSTQIIRQGHEVTPRFVALTSDGPHTIVLPLPDSMEERARGIRLLRLFLIWKQAHALIGSAELKEPNAVVAYGLMGREAIVALRAVRTNPLQFGDVEWLGAEAVGEEVLNLLPARISTLSREELAELEGAFGPDGGFLVIGPNTEIG